MNATQKHFESSATQYSQRCMRGVWGQIKKRERDVVASLLPSHAESALDLGCGTGFYSRLLLENKVRRILAVDFSPAMLSEFKVAGCETRLANVETFVSETPISLIVCAGVLEFVTDPCVLLSNLRRSLAPGGKLICLFPTRHFANALYRWHHRRHGVHVRLFSPPELEKLAGEVGFRMEIVVKPVPTSAVARFS